jgi:hypothetical protein
MLGVDDFLVILAATTFANLVVEVGAEVIAEWWVNSPEAATAPGAIDPSAASEQIGYAPQMLTQISAEVDQAPLLSERVADTLGIPVSEHVALKIDQTAVWSSHVIDKLSAKADALGVKATETALWSEQMISTLSTSLGLQ